MLTKQNFIDSICFNFPLSATSEAKLVRKIFEFRPTPKQRSMHELMTYLSYIFGAAMDNVKGDGMTSDNWKSASEIWKQSLPPVTMENFSDLIKKEEAHIKKVVGEMSETELNEEVTLYGKSQSRALHLLNGPFKWAPAYKLQLFMYLKMTGQEHLGTGNLWAGMDPMPKE